MQGTKHNSGLQGGFCHACCPGVLTVVAIWVLAHKPMLVGCGLMGRPNCCAGLLFERPVLGDDLSVAFVLTLPSLAAGSVLLGSAPPTLQIAELSCRMESAGPDPLCNLRLC